jgi:sulfonate transport system permease protein
VSIRSFLRLGSEIRRDAVSRSKPRSYQMIERELTRRQTYASRIALVASFLLLWQLLPQIPNVNKVFPVLDTFFLSSPVRVAQTMGNLMTGSGGLPSIWPYVGFTLQATFLGASIGIISGALMGLLLSNDLRLRQVLTPFINAVNSVPKIALIPVFIIVLGPDMQASVAASVWTVFFTVFFNAYAGGRGVPIEMLQNARLLGASPLGMMLHIRLMFVVQWTFAALPNALSHGLLGVVTTELLSGAGGMGSLILQSMVFLNASLTFAIVVFLSVIGVSMVTIADQIRIRVLHWWPGAQ